MISVGCGEERKISFVLGGCSISDRKLKKCVGQINYFQSHAAVSWDVHGIRLSHSSYTRLAAFTRNLWEPQSESDKLLEAMLSSFHLVLSPLPSSHPGGGQAAVELD